MSVAPETARFGEPKAVKELTEAFFEGGHFLENNDGPKPKKVKNIYRLNIVYQDGDKVNLEVIAESLSGVMEVERLLRTKPFTSSCMYKIGKQP